MYLVLELEPEVEEVIFDEFFHIEVVYSWISEASWTLVLQILESQWTSSTMPIDDELPECILVMEFVSEEEFWNIKAYIASVWV